MVCVNHNNMRHICAKELLQICDAYYCDYLTHICAKGLLDSNFNCAVIYKISIFKEIAQNFTYLQNHNFISLWELFRPTADFFPINFMVVTCEECNFLFLPVVSRY